VATSWLTGLSYESDYSAGAADLGGSYTGARWSYHYARPQGGWTESRAVEEYFHAVADNPAIDPGATMAGWDEAYRAEAARLGIRSDAGSANNILNYVRLQVGELTWREIASKGESVSPSGAGALEAPYIDVIQAREQAAIDTLRASGAEIDSTDANVLALLQSAGANFSAGIAQPLALSPVPNPDGRVPQAMGQGSPSVASPYSGLSSFHGFGTTGAYSDMPPEPTRAAGFSISPLLLLAGAGIVAYLVMRKS